MDDQKNAFANEHAWRALPSELDAELNHILNYWMQIVADNQRGGFYGKIDQDNKVYADSPRGSVLNARILWTFSAAYQYTQNPQHLQYATRAYHYIRDHLTDQQHGGLYWSVDSEGTLLDGHKQVYAQAFGIYAMSEYYRATSNRDALAQAMTWYELIEKYSRDPKRGGYIDAFDRDWSFLDDKRLSAKDENASKTMNTHLHIVEAYANLYEVSGDQGIRSDIIELLAIFNEKIIHKTSHHLALFFNDQWQMDDRIISYGHDIEAAWLLTYCAESAGDPESIAIAKKNAVFITNAAMEGMDEDGGLWYEYNLETRELVREKHWWPQAEAMVGLFNAWQLTQNGDYKIALIKTWQFIKNSMIDPSRGEWFWGIDGEGKKMPGQDKAGFWKCPYHNSRACLQLLTRLQDPRDA